jgi:hypothetical protein
MKFNPSSNFYLASPDERSQLIFPQGWDISNVSKHTEDINAINFPSNEYQNRLYGDIWLLEQIAKKTGIRQDLETVFKGNCEFVDDLLTLAMYPYITQFSYNRVARWQKIVKSPSSRELTPSLITKITQSITEGHRIELLNLRSARLEKDELCSVDSTSRSAYGDSLTDIRWGKNKEGLPLAQTVEVVVYTLSSHLPVYYRTFPGNMPDFRSLDVILKDLDRAGFKNLVFITDRGYENIHNIENLLSRNESMIMCAKTSQKIVSKVISELGTFVTRPDVMKIDTEYKLYCKQYDIDYKIETTSTEKETIRKLKVNLYFDPVRRAEELVELDITVENQKALLDEMIENGAKITNDANIKKDYCYYEVIYDHAAKVLLSYKPIENKIVNARNSSGFFSILTHGVDFDALETLRIYGLRDEQEK